jgi:hypothetical protein
MWPASRFGSLYPKIYEEDEEEEEWETDSEGIAAVDLEGNEFTRYTGTDELMVKMDECFDSWNEWVPDSPLEASLKNAVDKAGQNSVNILVCMDIKTFDRSCPVPVDASIHRNSRV